MPLDIVVRRSHSKAHIVLLDSSGNIKCAADSLHCRCLELLKFRECSALPVICRVNSEYHNRIFGIDSQAVYNHSLRSALCSNCRHLLCESETCRCCCSLNLIIYMLYHCLILESGKTLGSCNYCDIFLIEKFRSHGICNCLLCYSVHCNLETLNCRSRFRCRSRFFLWFLVTSNHCQGS